MAAILSRGGWGELSPAVTIQYHKRAITTIRGQHKSNNVALIGCKIPVRRSVNYLAVFSNKMCQSIWLKISIWTNKINGIPQSYMETVIQSPILIWFIDIWQEIFMTHRH